MANSDERHLDERTRVGAHSHARCGLVENLHDRQEGVNAQFFGDRVNLVVLSRQGVEHA